VFTAASADASAVLNVINRRLEFMHTAAVVFSSARINLIEVIAGTKVEPTRRLCFSVLSSPQTRTTQSAYPVHHLHKNMRESSSCGVLCATSGSTILIYMEHHPEHGTQQWLLLGPLKNIQSQPAKNRPRCTRICVRGRYPQA
jgi:hypothetical protein